MSDPAMKRMWDESPVIRLCCYVATAGVVLLLITSVTFVVFVNRVELKYCAAHPESLLCEP